MTNCIQYYQTAEEIGAETLKQHCSQLISNHWVNISIAHNLYLNILQNHIIFDNPEKISGNFIDQYYRKLEMCLMYNMEDESIHHAKS